MEFLCLDFINGKAAPGAAQDALPQDDAAWLSVLCRKWGVPEPLKETEGALLRLRDVMRSALLQYCKSGAIPAGALDELNLQLAPVTFYRRLEPCARGVRLTEMEQGAQSGLLPYLAVMSFACLLGKHEGGRIKFCENPGCGWFFYDESKSRTRRWCCNTCASLIKVRRFRQKRFGA